MVLLIPRSLWIKVYGCLLCLDLDGFSVVFQVVTHEFWMVEEPDADG